MKKYLKREKMREEKGYTKYFYKHLFGKHLNSTLEKRIFILFAFLGAVLSFLGTMINVFLGFDFILILIIALGFFIMTALFIIARKSSDNVKHTLPFFIISFLFCILNFIINDGYDGNAISLFMVVFLGLYILIPDKLRFLYFLFYLGTLEVLMYVQFYYSPFISPYTNNYQRFIDLFTSNILFFSILFSIISLVFGQYKLEREKVELASEKLRESEEKYRTIIDTSPDGITIVDLEGKINFMSDTGIKMHGFASLEELRGKSAFELFSSKDIKRAKEDFRRFFLEGIKPKSETYELLKKNGDVFQGQINVEMQKNKNGEPVGAIGITRDITEKVELEEQLQIRQRMDSIGTLAGGIAHDFNNLLTAISGYLSILERADNLNSKQKSFITSVLHASKRASDLTKQLQSLSKTDVSEITNIDLSKIVIEVFSLLGKTTDRMIEKKNEIEKNRYFVKGNLTELQQVFLNLGTNSIHAIEEKDSKSGEYIRVSAEEYKVKNGNRFSLAAGNYIHVVFEDTGSGMKEEVKRRAFDPLFTTKAQGEGKRGQGLGLAMVYNIITRKHKGFIEIDSNPGDGAFVHIYIPESDTETVELKHEEDTRLTGDETILVAEDEYILAEIAREILEESGYKTIIAKNGKEALEIFQENPEIINLVLLDLTMPVMSGGETLEKLLQIKPGLNVVICSGHSFEEAAEKKNILVKAKAFLSKPYTAQSLLKIIRETLDSPNIIK